VVFGLLQGAMVGGHQAMRLFLPRLRLRRRYLAPLAAPLTTIAMCVSAVFFRAPSLDVAGQVLGGVLHHPWVWDSRYDVHLAMVALLWLLGTARHLRPSGRSEAHLPAPVRALLLAFLMLVVLYGAVDTRERFIYFQF